MTVSVVLVVKQRNFVEIESSAANSGPSLAGEPPSHSAAAEQLRVEHTCPWASDALGKTLKASSEIWVMRVPPRFARTSSAHEEKRRVASGEGDGSGGESGGGKGEGGEVGGAEGDGGGREGGGDEGEGGIGISSNGWSAYGTWRVIGGL